MWPYSPSAYRAAEAVVPGWGCAGLSARPRELPVLGKGPASRPEDALPPSPGPWVWEGHECFGLVPPCAAGKGGSL